MTFKRLFLTFFVVALVPAAGHSVELPEFTELIEDVSPAVVKITTTGTIGGAQGIPQEEIPELFRRFFDPREQMPERNIGGMGSGFIISEDGYVVTNNHVIANANEIVVRLGDRREYEAEVVGTDERSDIALLKIDADDLPALEFARGDIQVGEWVLAIGSPFGLDFSASQGIVSAVGRDIPNGGAGNYVPFIQSDVAINPGNSGGPLFNLDGEVVGVNSQIYTRSGGYMGLSFAIPADLAESVVGQLKNKGRVERGYLGVQIRDLTRDEASAFGLSRSRGALVLDVLRGSPAAEAGVQPGDVVLEFGNTRINDSGDLPVAVGNTEPGKEMEMVVMRQRQERSLEVTVGTLDDEPAQQASDDGMPEEVEGEADRLGLVVENLRETLRDNLEVDGGVMVTQVEPDTPAAEARLRRGDVIVQLGFENVSTVEEYEQIVGSLPTDSPVPLRFYRQGSPQYSTIEISEE